MRSGNGSRMGFGYGAVLCALLLVSWAPGKTGAQCIDYQRFMHWVGGLDLGGHAEQLAVAGDVAYLADDELGFLVIDVSDPRGPFLVGSLATLLQVSGLATNGVLVAAVGDSSLLTLVDVSDPSSPAVLGTAATPGEPFDVTLSDHYAYVTDGVAGLLVYDISAPETPAIIGSWNPGGRTYGVAVDGTWAYVGGGLTGFHLLDISNPQEPQHVGSVFTGGIASCVHKHARGVFVGDRTGRLHLIDISFPATPRLRASIETPGYLWNVVVGAYHAYVADRNFGVFGVNITDPDDLRAIDSAAIPGQAFDIGLHGDYACVAAGDAGLQIVRISGLPQVSPLASVDTPSWTNAVDVRRGVACVANGDAGLGVFDVSNPRLPQAAGVLPMTFASGVAMHAWHAYATDESRGVLAVVNVSDPLLPWTETELPLPGNAKDVVLADTLALVAAANRGLQVVDVRDFLSPQVVGSIDTVYVSDVAVSGQRACLVGLTWLRVADFSDPQAPQLIGRMALASPAFGVASDGSYAYVATDGAGVQIVDLSDVEAPAVVAEVPAFGPVTDVTLAGAYLYFVDRTAWGAGLHVVDVSDPAEPLLVGRTGMPDGANAVTVYGSYVYTTGSSAQAGLRVYAAQCGGVTPVMVTDLEALPEPDGIRLRWILHTDLFRGFEVQRAVGADAPADAFVSHLFLPEGDNHLATGLREILDRDVIPGVWYRYRILGLPGHGEPLPLGTVVARARSWTGVLLASPRPNPAISGTTLRMDLPRSAHAKLEILDAGGRHVRTLLQEGVAAGTRTLYWDGCDGAGRRVPSGVYQLRLAAGYELASQRILLLR